MATNNAALVCEDLPRPPQPGFFLALLTLRGRMGDITGLRL